MKFVVYEKGMPMNGDIEQVRLRRDNWDDYSFKTAFDAYYCDCFGVVHDLGTVRIGRREMPRGRIFDDIPKEFDMLPDEYFSLGYEEYYKRIAVLSDQIRITILTALRDVAFDLSIFERNINEDVMTFSLLRDCTSFTVRSQLHRMAHGGVRLTVYAFIYRSTILFNDISPSYLTLDFTVSPESNPPTNIHVLIGRNGTGKTHLLRDMIRSILCANNNDANKDYGTFEYSSDELDSPKNRFANLLCVAFSPFDDYSFVLGLNSTIPYTYIGLDRQSPDLLGNIAKQFWISFQNCMQSEGKKNRWRTIIEILKSDPTFFELPLEELINDGENKESFINNDVQEKTIQAFNSLSSGHKVSLLIMTCCVDKLEEKSIVFIDEPENHLHPPLLSAFVRALSNLLTNRNGVAIISTHSPVVLQEVPRSCVWALRRQGDQKRADRLTVETFGSSIGLLTSEVFGLEVEKSGFHKLLSEAVVELGDYDAIMRKFNGQLGEEARGILRILLATIGVGRHDR